MTKSKGIMDRRPYGLPLQACLDRKTDKKSSNTGCWIWTGTKINRGYGSMLWERRYHLTHRLAWMSTKGNIPKGLQVLHHCDVKACVNPDHLFVGTQKQNMADMDEKGRRRNGPSPGEKNGIAKLTARRVRQARSSDKPHRFFAEKFGVSIALISLVRLRRIWKHIN